jgi:aminopeptidase
MVDQRIEKLARLCVHYSVDVKPKEKVVIRGSTAAAPLITEIYKECLLADAYPWILPNLGADYLFLKLAKKHQLEYVSPFTKFIFENTDVDIAIFCEPNPKRLTNIDPAVIRANQASSSELMGIYFKRVYEGTLRWTGLPYPISDQAQEASMALPEYEDFVYGSCLVDEENPIAEWEKIRAKQEETCNFLNRAESIRVVGEDTDLTFKTKGRKWINGSGEQNMPDGEVFTSPVDDSANGEIRFTFPGIYLGREVEDISLIFKNGEIIKASAAKGEDLLKELIKIEGANRIGETAIGTNYSINRFTKNMLFDEKMGGTVHVAIGFAFPESGGINKSAIHWDILKDMRKDGEIYADGELFYKNGRFLT